VRSPARSPASRLASIGALLVAFAVALSACSATTGPPVARDAAPVELRLLLTTDEHDWIEPLLDGDTRRGGVVQAFDQMSRDDALGSDGVVLLSAGDMWTGPYESTMLKGKPMLEAFNRMGYAAAVVGNHNFDFGLEILARRSDEAEFPFLAANVRRRSSGEMPAWAEASTLVESAGVKVGVIGLANIDTPKTTHPRTVASLEFTDYLAAIRAEVPRLRAAGAELIVVLIHDGLLAAATMRDDLRRLGVHVVGAGHVHQPGIINDDGGTPDRPDDDIVMCNAGPYFRTYCRIDVTMVGSRLVSHDATIVEVSLPAAEEPASPDPDLLEIVAEAKRKSSVAIAEETLVVSPEPIARRDGALGQMITDAWLTKFPDADVAITNAGGIRQGLAAGDVRIRDVISVLPFKNYLVVVDIDGKQLREALTNPESIASGVRYTYRDVGAQRTIVDLTDVAGRSIADDEALRVVVNDFMYSGGDGYLFYEYDPDAFTTPVDWRGPVITQLRKLGEAGRQLEISADDRARPVN